MRPHCNSTSQLCVTRSALSFNMPSAITVTKDCLIVERSVDDDEVPCTILRNSDACTFDDDSLASERIEVPSGLSIQLPDHNAHAKTLSFI